MTLQSSILEIKVITGARQNEVCEIMADGSLKLKIHAKPIEGKANQELIEFLSEILQVSRNEIEIVRGEHSKRKVLKITGISQPELQKRLDDLMNLQDP